MAFALACLCSVNTYFGLRIRASNIFEGPRTRLLFSGALYTLFIVRVKVNNMQREKNILVDRGIPMTPHSFGGISVGGSSGRLSTVDIFMPGGTREFSEDWNDLTDYDIKRMMRDLNVHYLRGRIISALDRVQVNLDRLYANSSAVTDVLVEQELAASGFTHGESREHIANNKDVVDNLIKKNNQNLSAFITKANLYSGGDPLALTQSQRTQIGMKAMGSAISLYPERAKEQVESYATSYTAAKDALMLRQVIDRLVSRSAALSNQLVAMDAVAKAANTFRVSAETGAAQLSMAAGSIALTPGATLTLEAAIQAGIQALKAFGSMALDRATGVGIGLLVYSPALGNSDLYPPTMVTLPAKKLAPDLPVDLQNVAATGGTVDVPYRIYGNAMTYSMIATQAGSGVLAKVPVRILALDPVLNAYTFTTADTPPRTLVLPIATPGNSSTATPENPVDVPVYTGVTLTPIELKVEALPAADQLDIRDCIYCFPADSGLPPIYAVFSSPYKGATTKGEYSGRMYNPDHAGGPTQNLDWTTASVSQEGIDLVKLHTGRFEPSDANRIMIDRLEKILHGEITITDVDKRFYTHEIRELERYRALGITDGVAPDDEGATWNNTHAATLEDYRIKDATTLLYTSEAIAADYKQVYGE